MWLTWRRAPGEGALSRLGLEYGTDEDVEGEEDEKGEKGDGDKHVERDDMLDSF